MFADFSLGKRAFYRVGSVQPFGSAKDAAVSTQIDGIPLNKNSLGKGIRDLVRIEKWKL